MFKTTLIFINLLRVAVQICYTLAALPVVFIVFGVYGAVWFARQAYREIV